MRLCFICNEYPPARHGGIGIFTQILARALVGAGHEVRVVGIYPPACPSPEFEDDHGVRVWRLREPVCRFHWVVARFHLYRTVSQWARREEIDLVEVPDYEGWAACWPCAGRTTGVR